jgi:hypothetical protein
MAVARLASSALAWTKVPSLKNGAVANKTSQSAVAIRASFEAEQLSQGG